MLTGPQTCYSHSDQDNWSFIYSILLLKIEFFHLAFILQDGYNPFLELSLSAGKKISSVIKHLNSKWGSSSMANGQLMLFPYNMKTEKIASCRKWTSNDSGVTAGEVYVAVESPSIFRLRSEACCYTIALCSVLTVQSFNLLDFAFQVWLVLQYSGGDVWSSFKI